MKLSEALEKVDEGKYSRAEYYINWTFSSILPKLGYKLSGWDFFEEKVMYKGEKTVAWTAMVDAYLNDNLSFKEIARQLADSGA